MHRCARAHLVEIILEVVHVSLYASLLRLPDELLPQITVQHWKVHVGDITMFAGMWFNYREILPTILPKMSK